MKRMTVQTSALGLITIAIAAFGTALTGCSIQNQLNAASPQMDMDHSSMDGMNDMNMDLGPADADFDLRFIDAMTPHHQGGVDMATEAMQKSKRPEMQKLSTDIIAAQQKEIAQMKQWRQAWYPNASAEPIAYDAQMGHSMPMTQDQMKSMMMSVDLGAADANFDMRFINAMIPHHKGALTMAQDALTKSKRPEVQKMASDIIKSQSAEISEMEQWRKAWYNQ